MIEGRKLSSALSNASNVQITKGNSSAAAALPPAQFGLPWRHIADSIAVRLFTCRLVGSCWPALRVEQINICSDCSSWELRKC
jgi:hypothetical protein